ncbi:MAG: BadF/BadG/BcrA/BcrD ATPase family protein [Fervidobacterium nodosum]
MNILGIDAGGSNSRFCLYNSDDKRLICDFKFEDGLNLTSTTVSEQKLILKKAFKKLGEFVDFKEYRIDKIVCSVSGAGEKGRKNKFEQLVKSIFNCESVIVMSDIEALRRILIEDNESNEEKKGIVVIAGTGSIAFSHNGYRIGGWGHLFDDEASGFSIGLRIIKNFFNYIDGVEPYDIIFDWLLDYFGIKIDDVVKITNIQKNKKFKAKIASITKFMPLTPLVKKIIEEEINLFTEKIKVLAGKSDTKVIYTHGGMFENSFYRETFVKQLSDYEVHIETLQVHVELAKLLSD